MQVSASDADDPETPNAHLSFSIDNQIPSPTNTPYFGINSENGEIFITEEGKPTILKQKVNLDRCKCMKLNKNSIFSW